VLRSLTSAVCLLAMVQVATPASSQQPERSPAGVATSAPSWSIGAGPVQRNRDLLQVTIRGRKTGVIQPLERQLTLRAQELISQAMCGFNPSPGLRLSAALKGFQVTQVSETEGILEVTVEAPVQTPRCEVLRVPIVAPPSQPSMVVTASSSLGVSASPTTTPVPTAAPASMPAMSSGPITQVRKNEGEY
jgi:hypothetical protein